MTIRQEGWLSPTERASISLRHNLATTRESRRYVVVTVVFSRFAGGVIWLPQESLRYLLATPGYAPATTAVSVTWMERRFNYACKRIAAFFHALLDPDSCLYHLIPNKRDNSQIRKLRKPAVYEVFFARTNKFRNSFIM